MERIEQKEGNAITVLEWVNGKIDIEQTHSFNGGDHYVRIEKQSIPALIEALKKHI